MNDKYYKKHIEKLINSNPTEINIKRQIKTDDGFGGSLVTPVNIKEVVTFYDTKARREIVTNYGKSYAGISITKILAKGDADIIKGDIFTVEGVEYQVLFVNNYKGICKQIELEVVK